MISADEDRKRERGCRVRRAVWNLRLGDGKSGERLGLGLVGWFDACLGAFW